jgi:hypothetical protein
MILAMGAEMLGEVVDALSEHRNLNFSPADILRARTELGSDFALSF